MTAGTTAKLTTAKLTGLRVLLLGKGLGADVPPGPLLHPQARCDAGLVFLQFEFVSEAINHPAVLSDRDIDA